MYELEDDAITACDLWIANRVEKLQESLKFCAPELVELHAYSAMADTAEYINNVTNRGLCAALKELLLLLPDNQAEFLAKTQQLIKELEA